MTVLTPARQQALRYASVGLLNTGTDLACFLALHHWAGLGPELANVLAFVIAATQGYLMNQRWTFADAAGPSWRGWLAYLGVNTAGVAISTATIYLLADQIGAIGAKLVATVLVFAWGFLAARRWIFTSSSR